MKNTIQGLPSPLTFIFYARGHPNILCTHLTTIEFTREKVLGSNGNCIAGVESTVSSADMPLEVKQNLSKSTGKGRLSIKAGNHEFNITGSGAEGLTFKSLRDLVIRKSNFISERTLMVNADKASIDLPREMVRLLQNPATIIKLELYTFISPC